ncbi:MAG: hypothetical protein NTZ48_05795 [Candidatus Omnitrophica bacterium]|nr:hypothetical protein [Candidatus Omnitrophota bacterium]
MPHKEAAKKAMSDVLNRTSPNGLISKELGNSETKITGQNGQNTSLKVAISLIIRGMLYNRPITKGGIIL